MKKDEIDLKLMKSLASGDFGSDVNNSELLIEIHKQEIFVSFYYPRMKSTASIQSDEIPQYSICYHIPDELIEVFTAQVEEFKEKEMKQVMQDIHHWSTQIQQAEDYKQQLVILTESPLWQLEKKRKYLSTLNRDLVAEYLQDRINAKVLKYDKSISKNAQHYIKALTIGEKMAQGSLELKRICDHIVHDIHTTFQFIAKTPRIPNKLLNNIDCVDRILEDRGYDHMLGLSDDMKRMLLIQELTETKHEIIKREKKMRTSKFGSAGPEGTKRSRKNTSSNPGKYEKRKNRNTQKSDEDNW